MLKKKPSAKQIAARKKFIAAVRAGKFLKGKKKATVSGAKKKSPRKKAAKKSTSKKRSASSSRAISGVNHTYNVFFENKKESLVRTISSTSLREARAIASLHKKNTPALKGYRCKVKLAK